MAIFQMSSRDLPYAGAAVLVERGSCTFSDKAQALSAAHAAVMIVYNNDEGRHRDFAQFCFHPLLYVRETLIQFC